MVGWTQQGWRVGFGDFGYFNYPIGYLILRPRLDFSRQKKLAQSLPKACGNFLGQQRHTHNPSKVRTSIFEFRRSLPRIFVDGLSLICEVCGLCSPLPPNTPNANYSVPLCLESRSRQNKSAFHAQLIMNEMLENWPLTCPALSSVVHAPHNFVVASLLACHTKLHHKIWPLC